ncbi:CopG family transcriptional regulator (plasmid) [Pseudomonas viciae]|uniref:CopG family transcriptional regulator n=1 Tax=Pseudomonas viciae TaxID=2505979 RepID=A0ABY8PMD2_9PSED|nr:CopG family transcriptional regulator [Pseudomonas viciae]WGO96400.1 CopG family transcriptional regulator [Pseudomonas viciae]
MSDSEQPKLPRRRGKPIEVWVNEEEKALITERAVSVGLSRSGFLRALGLNHPIRSKADSDAVMDLMRINGDLGRLGGLLKLWLSERPGAGAPVADVRTVLREIQDQQQLLRTTASKVGR